MLRSAVAVTIAMLLAGCGLTPAPLYVDQSSRLEARLPVVARDDLLSEISVYQGAPYEEGGSSITGVDCSGLVRSVYGSLGVSLPRKVTDQYGQGVPVGRPQVRTGDLVFFSHAAVPSHVGIAVSNGEMVHSSSSRGVVLEGIDQFSKTMRLVGIRRIVRLN